MDWKNTRAALEAYGEELVNSLQDILIDKDHINHGTLFNTMKYEVRTSDEEISLWLWTEDYFKYLERGIEPAGDYKNPGWKAYPFIRQWIIDKPVTPYKDSKGRLPSVDSLAFLITRKRVQEGAEPEEMLSTLVKDMNDKYEPIIEEAISEDIGDEVANILIQTELW